jgi:type IV pilus assembly protein PilC
MADPAAQPTAFAYRALNAEGRPIAGTLDAADLTQARSLLASMGLQLTELQALQAPMRPAALRGADLQAFNEQLAYLTQAGLPVERGLRLIASEMRHPRLAQTIRRIAEEA